MPTARPRHQVTENADVAHGIDRAATRWSGEPRSKPPLRLVDIGSLALESEQQRDTEARRTTVTSGSGTCADAFGRDFLTDLRQDWPE